MTTIPATPMMSDIKKLSFAKVAASASKEVGHMPRIAVPVPVMKGERGSKAGRRSPLAAPMAAEATEASKAQKDGKLTAQASGENAPQPSDMVADSPSESKVVEGLKELKLDVRPPSLIVNGSGSSSTEQSSKTGNSQTPSDDVSQKADSSSELGTKPPSLDGKSITSGTTFNVLDEKESLRPDDSASVKAAADEDDAFSVRGSLLANSRMGSDVAGRLRSIQIGDMPPRVIAAHVLPEAHVQGVVTPESGASGQQPVSNGDIPLAAATVSAEAFSNFYSQNPDEKLLDAMKSPKDRLFLLRLEKDVIDFVQDSKEPFMDLPPSNSFCRLLTHKLADYYHMTHSFEAVAGAVRIYRTPFCRVPPSLGSIATANESATSTPPPAMLPKRIMRRGVDGESAPVSAGPSKPTSEVGSELKDKSGPTKEKLTREEREEAYNKARLRIFGSAPQTEASTPENEDNTGVSRASSVSAKDKSSLGKRGKPSKQRRDDSESFDSRSQYTPFWGHPQQMTWAPHSFVAGNGGSTNQFPAPMQPQPPFQNPMAAPGFPQNQTYPANVLNGGYVPQPQFNGMTATYPAAAPVAPARFPQQAAPQMPIYGPPAQGTNPQAWQTQTFANQVPQPPPPQPQMPRLPPAGLGAGIPYPYGQLPVPNNPRDHNKPQHPIPGSYNRHGFNPKTQSFVPGGGMPAMSAGPPINPMPPTTSLPGPYPGPGQQQLNVAPMVTALPPPSMPLAFNGYQGPPPPLPGMTQPPYAGNGSGYGMMRQGSSNSGLHPHHPMMASLPSHPTSHPQQLPPQPGVLPGDAHGHQQHPQPHPPHQHPPNAPMHHTQPHVHYHQHHSPRMPNKPAVAHSSAATSVTAAKPATVGGSSGPQAFPNLPTYGNPATLPQKPSTS